MNYAFCIFSFTSLHLVMYLMQWVIICRNLELTESLHIILLNIYIERCLSTYLNTSLLLEWNCFVSGGWCVVHATILWIPLIVVFQLGKNILQNSSLLFPLQKRLAYQSSWYLGLLIMISLLMHCWVCFEIYSALPLGFTVGWQTSTCGLFAGRAANQSEINSLPFSPPPSHLKQLYSFDD